MKMWNEISSAAEAKAFMAEHEYFHDSCIKELKYISGAYVNAELAMYPVNDRRTLTLLIQRQYREHSVIELEFVGLKYMKMSPACEAFTCEILDATLIFKDDCVLWCDCGSLREADMESYEGTVICASKIRWKTAEEYIGSREIYTAS